MELLSFPTEQGGGWFRFPFRSPNTLQASQLETAFHGTHMECLHGLMATGRIMPSNDKVAGTGTARSTCTCEPFVRWRSIQLVRPRGGRKPTS